MRGVRKNVRAADVMTPEPECVDPSTTLDDLARIFETYEFSGAPVVDAQGAVVGIVSKTDVIRLAARDKEQMPPAWFFETVHEQRSGEEDERAGVEPGAERRVEDVMTEGPVMVSPETDITVVASRMLERRIHRVVVVDAERFPLGIITSLDLLGALLYEGE